MDMKKIALITSVILLVLILPLVNAELKIEKQAVVDSIITELNNPAEFQLTLTNQGDTDNFKIFSLVGIDISPNESFTIPSGETKTIDMKLTASQKILETPGVFNFIYKIQSSSGIQEDALALKIARIKDAIEINSYNINLDSDTALVYAKSLVGYKFDDVKVNFHSAFFDFTKTFSLDQYQKEEFSVVLNKEETKKLVAGDYTLTADIEVAGIKTQSERVFKFTEKANVQTKESSSGIIIRKYQVDKINQGNLPTVVQVEAKKNIISRLFTTFNQDPSSVERKGLVVYYTFQKEIMPAETYTVRTVTNWLYPLILILALIIIGYLYNLYTSTDVILKKKATYVKTKGGEFALKVTITVKAKKYLDKLTIIDRLPAMVKVFPHFPAAKPTKVDETNKRIQWDLENLQQYEERFFSYVIYSKIGVVGKFELPTATAIFEQAGKLHEVSSNKVFFITGTRREE